MYRKNLTHKTNKLRAFSEFQGFEATENVEKHLQIPIDKPCFALYLSGKIWPVTGERGLRFYALAAEFRRIGTSEETALNKLMEYYNKIPRDIIQSPGKDGLPFNIKEVETAVKSAYRSDKVKSYGCNHPIWETACSGKEFCLFYQRLTGGKGQSRGAAHDAFITHWLGKGKDGKKLLFDSDIRVYLGIEAAEKKRGYQHGHDLFISWRELSELSGVSRQNIGDSLMNLFWAGLIRYKKGLAQERGSASEISRVIPVPKPGNGVVKNDMVNVAIYD